MHLRKLLTLQELAGQIKFQKYFEGGEKYPRLLYDQC